MTFRAILIGLIGAFLIADAGYINDSILRLESVNSGHLLAIMVLGPLFLFVFGLNPVLFRLRRSWALRPAELAVVVTLGLVACSIPGRGLMETFTQILVMPYHWARVNPGWSDRHLMDYVPEHALVAVNEGNYERAVAAYITGTSAPGQEAGGLVAGLRRLWGDVPWSAWVPPLATWLPMILLSAAASVALALIVHRQWSEHELLSYPIAVFTHTLVEREPDHAFPVIFRSRLFWIGLGVMFAIRVNNGLYVWWPDYLVPIQLGWSLRPFLALMPRVQQVQWGPDLFYLNVFPLVVAFAFFLSTEISLTLGVAQFLWVLLGVPLIGMGINLSTDYGTGGWQGYERAGACVALALTMLYTGRYYYWSVLRRGLLLGGTDRAVDASTVWACRVLLVSTAGLIGLVCALGLELPFAILTVLLMLLTFVTVSRVCAETGMFFMQPRWLPFGILMSLFGGYTMGPKAIFICALVCTVLCVDPSQAVMPYLTNGLKLGERVGLAPRRLATWVFGMYAVAVPVAVVVALCATYHYGTPVGSDWSYQRIPSMPFRAVDTEVLTLRAIGTLADAEQLPWTQRLAGLVPKESFLSAAGFGVAAVLLFSFLRLRLSWWPLHPVLFVVWATYPIGVAAWSFLIGWLIKKSVLRFAGPAAVHQLRPLMIGVIAGEILGALVFMLFGAWYFFHSGRPPQPYFYFPR